MLFAITSKSISQREFNPFLIQANVFAFSPQNMVPALIESIKVAGLVLVSDTSEDSTARTRSMAAARSYRMPDGVDGVLRGNGVLRFNETIDM